MSLSKRANDRLATTLAVALATVTPPAPAAAVNTASIVAATTAALPSCVQWRPVGVCTWLKCSLTGCEVRTSLKVRNYVPDAVVTVRNDMGSHPWAEMSALTATAAGVASTLAGGLVDGGASSGPTGETFRDRQRSVYREADVIGHPLGAAQFLALLGVGGPVCWPRATPLFPYFQSGADALVWRGFVPVESLYPAALIPGLREVGTFPANTWGSVHPRVGRIVHPEEPKAAAVIAQRAGDIVTRPTAPHVYVPLAESMLEGGYRWWDPGPLVEGDAETGVWQMLAPKPDSGCYVFGANDSLSPIGWADGRMDVSGDYVFNLWRPYACCSKEGLFIGSFDW